MANDYVTVEVKGLAELQTKLEALPEKLAKKSLRKAIRAGAAVFQNAMASLAPKETGFEAEHISIRTRLSHDELAITAQVGPNNKVLRPERIGKIGRKGKEWGQRSAALVARFLEFGTSRHGKKPFLSQAFESNKAEALEAITEKLREALKDLE